MREHFHFYLKWIRLKRRMNLIDQVRFTYVNTLDQYTAWKLGKCYTSYILPGPWSRLQTGAWSCRGGGSNRRFPGRMNGMHILLGCFLHHLVLRSVPEEQCLPHGHWDRHLILHEQADTSAEMDFIIPLIPVINGPDRHIPYTGVP